MSGDPCRSKIDKYYSLEKQFIEVDERRPRANEEITTAKKEVDKAVLEISDLQNQFSSKVEEMDKLTSQVSDFTKTVQGPTYDPTSGSMKFPPDWNVSKEIAEQINDVNKNFAVAALLLTAGGVEGMAEASPTMRGFALGHTTESLGSLAELHKNDMVNKIENMLNYNSYKLAANERTYWEGVQNELMYPQLAEILDNIQRLLSEINKLNSKRDECFSKIQEKQQMVTEKEKILSNLDKELDELWKKKSQAGRDMVECIKSLDRMPIPIQEANQKHVSQHVEEISEIYSQIHENDLKRKEKEHL